MWKHSLPIIKYFFKRTGIPIGILIFDTEYCRPKLTVHLTYTYVPSLILVLPENMPLLSNKYRYKQRYVERLENCMDRILSSLVHGLLKGKQLMMCRTGSSSGPGCHLLFLFSGYNVLQFKLICQNPVRFNAIVFYPSLWCHAPPPPAVVMHIFAWM